jgi:hypothetical protein
VSTFVVFYYIASIFLRKIDGSLWLCCSTVLYSLVTQEFLLPCNIKWPRQGKNSTPTEGRPLWPMKNVAAAALQGNNKEKSKYTKLK